MRDPKPATPGMLKRRTPAITAVARLLAYEMFDTMGDSEPVFWNSLSDSDKGRVRNLATRNDLLYAEEIGRLRAALGKIGAIASLRAKTSTGAVFDDLMEIRLQASSALALSTVEVEGGDVSSVARAEVAASSGVKSESHNHSEKD